MQPLRSRLGQTVRQRPCIASHPRDFSSRPPLRFIRRGNGRPQLSFLSRSSGKSKPNATRLLSTEQKESMKYQVKLGLYWSVIGWVIIGAGALEYFIVKQDWLERLYPTPDEWYYPTRYYYKTAKHEEATEGEGRGIINWGRVSTHLRLAVAYAEDFRFIISRPSGIEPQQDWDHSIPGITDEELRQPVPNPLYKSRIGFDISMKSEGWRRGYFDAMMLMCRSAEHQTGWLTELKTRLNFPPEHVRSAGNPYPKPLPPGSPYAIPNEEDCIPAFEPADFHYQRMLTTKGFSREQYMQAGIAYALWKSRCGENDTAEKLYRWALDLACQGVPDSATIVDKKTAIIKPKAPMVSSNILAATTALANHYARHDKVPAALNIYLSVLRARRQSPEAPTSKQYKPKSPDLSLRSIDSWVNFAVSMARVTRIPYPPPPPSGDLPFERTANTECEEAALMAYVGEVLFARGSKSRMEGLSWTRDATAIAEAGEKDPKLDTASKKVCSQCFQTGLGNWAQMCSVLAREKASGSSSSSGLFGLGGFWSSENQKILQESDWEQEEKLVNDKLREYEEEKLNERLRELIITQSKWFVA